MTTGEAVLGGIAEEVHRDIVRGRVGRVLVSLDATVEGRRLLDAAASIAASLDSPLTGLFIEDADLLALAEMPFSRELALSSGQPRPLETHALEREYRAQAATMRDALAKHAAQHHLSWRYEVRRGQRLPSLIAESRSRDLVIVSCPPAHLRRPSDVRALVERAAESGGPDVLLVEPPRWPNTEAPPRRRGQILLTEDWASARTLADLIGTRLMQRHEIGLRHMYLKSREVKHLATEVKALEGDLLVLSTTHHLIAQVDDLMALISASKCPLLLVQPDKND